MDSILKQLTKVVQLVMLFFFFSQKDQKFLVVETTACLEAYRYVLDGLQELKEDNLSFQR